MNRKVSSALEYIDSVEPFWQRELLISIRVVILSCGLSEQIKWGGPVYVHHGNVVGIGAFKDHVAIWFFDGATLSDSNQILVAANQKTQALRQWRLVEGDVIDSDLLKGYVAEAALNMETGKRTAMAGPRPLIIPDLLQQVLDAEPPAAAYFASMRLTQKREFVEMIDTAKREETRLARLAKAMALIRANRGLNDKYRG